MAAIPAVAAEMIAEAKTEVAATTVVMIMAEAVPVEEVVMIEAVMTMETMIAAMMIAGATTTTTARPAATIPAREAGIPDAANMMMTTWPVIGADVAV